MEAKSNAPLAPPPFSSVDKKSSFLSFFKKRHISAYVTLIVSYWMISYFGWRRKHVLLPGLVREGTRYTILTQFLEIG